MCDAWGWSDILPSNIERENIARGGEEKQILLGLGPVKSAQHKLLFYSGHSPGCSQTLLLSGRISVCSCTDTAPDALSLGCSQAG